MQIGYVPQDDIIHRELTVAEVLTYAAKLRLPPDTDVAKVVEKTLQDVEMSHRWNARVCELSGGQRKRVSIGVELLADPKLFFLDEPTSGLDPGLDKKMMQLLRKLADQGRTVILVTHATANIKLCVRRSRAVGIGLFFLVKGDASVILVPLIMEGIGSKVSWLMLSRWSIGAYGTLVNINAMVPEAIKLPDGSTVTRPFEPTPVYDATWSNLGFNWGILCLHTAIYLAVTLWLQKRKDIF